MAPPILNMSKRFHLLKQQHLLLPKETSLIMAIVSDTFGLMNFLLLTQDLATNILVNSELLSTLISFPDSAIFYIQQHCAHAADYWSQRHAQHCIQV